MVWTACCLAWNSRCYILTSASATDTCIGCPSPFYLRHIIMNLIKTIQHVIKQNHYLTFHLLLLQEARAVVFKCSSQVTSSVHSFFLFYLSWKVHFDKFSNALPWSPCPLTFFLQERQCVSIHIPRTVMSWQNADKRQVEINNHVHIWPKQCSSICQQKNKRRQMLLTGACWAHAKIDTGQI